MIHNDVSSSEITIESLQINKYSQYYVMIRINDSEYYTMTDSFPSFKHLYRKRLNTNNVNTYCDLYVNLWASTRVIDVSYAKYEGTDATRVKFYVYGKE